jgi:hypothetical protein
MAKATARTGASASRDHAARKAISIPVVLRETMPYEVESLLTWSLAAFFAAVACGLRFQLRSARARHAAAEESLALLRPSMRPRCVGGQRFSSTSGRERDRLRPRRPMPEGPRQRRRRHVMAQGQRNEPQYHEVMPGRPWGAFSSGPYTGTPFELPVVVFLVGLAVALV